MSITQFFLSLIGMSRYQRCRRQFLRLDPLMQSLVKSLGQDPESLKQRGRL